MDLDSIVIKNLDVLTSLEEKDNLILYENYLILIMKMISSFKQ